jgi:hypothetical protein
VVKHKKQPAFVDKAATDLRLLFMFYSFLFRKIQKLAQLEIRDNHLFIEYDSPEFSLGLDDQTEKVAILGLLNFKRLDLFSLDSELYELLCI